MRLASIAIVALAALGAGCTDDPPTTESEALSGTASDDVAGAVAANPFCSAIDELLAIANTTSATLSDDDVARAVEIYRSLLDEAAPEVRGDLEAVIDGLARDVAGAPSTSTSSTPSTSTGSTATAPTNGGSVPAATDGPGEAYEPDSDAASRLNAYIQFECANARNNPGPPDTLPDAPVPESTLPGASTGG